LPPPGTWLSGPGVHAISVSNPLPFMSPLSPHCAVAVPEGQEDLDASIRPYGLQKPASEERTGGMTELPMAIAVIVLFGTIGMLVVDYVSRQGK